MGIAPRSKVHYGMAGMMGAPAGVGRVRDMEVRFG